MPSAKAGSKDAWSVALRFISLRPRSVKEVTEKLGKKGFSEAEIKDVTGRLIGQGLLDDSSFASFLASSRARVKNWGGRKIAAELSAKGVAGELIKKALASPDVPEEPERARAAFSRWLKTRNLATPLDKKGRQSAYRHLVARGFAHSLVMRTVGSRDADEE